MRQRFRRLQLPLYLPHRRRLRQVTGFVSIDNDVQLRQIWILAYLNIDRSGSRAHKFDKPDGRVLFRLECQTP